MSSSITRARAGDQNPTVPLRKGTSHNNLGCVQLIGSHALPSVSLGKLHGSRAPPEGGTGKVLLSTLYLTGLL